MKLRIFVLSTMILLLGAATYAAYHEQLDKISLEEMRTDQLQKVVPYTMKKEMAGFHDRMEPGKVVTLRPGSNRLSTMVKEGDIDTLSYHNGNPDYGFSMFGKDCMEVVEFFTEHPIKLLKLRFYTVGAPGPMFFQFYPSFGGAMPDFTTPLFPSTILRHTPSGNGVWNEIDLERFNLKVLLPGMFYFCHVKQANNPCVAGDDSLDSETHSYLYDPNETPGDPWDGYYLAGFAMDELREYVVELDVQYFNVVNDKTFSEITGLNGIGNTSRMAWGDYNNDGLDDVLLNGRYLYRNNGDGTFTDVSTAMGLDVISSTNGGVWADYDNDGWLDFYAHTGDITTTDFLMHNESGSGFIDQASFAGIGDTWKTEAAAWGDYDNDGYIDLYVANYEDCDRCPKHPDPCNDAVSPCWLSWGDPDILWHNNGDGTFTDVSASTGIDAAQAMSYGDAHCGRGVNWGDFDNDGDQDIYVSNYRLDPNFLWVNNGDGTFSEMSEHHGVKGVRISGSYGHTIGSTWGDIDNDGDLDLFVANLAHPRFIEFSDKSMMYVNSGAPDYLFSDIRESAGILYEETHSDSSFGDYDNDGWLDLFITSVYVGRKSTFYRNNHDHTFKHVNYDSGVIVDNGWAFAWVDYDLDGFLDLHNRSNFYRNHGNDNNWIIVRARGTASNWASIGARVTADAGGLSQIREIQGGEGTSHQNPLYARFGLGTATKVDTLTITWPSGRNFVLHDVDANQVIVVTEP